MEVIIIKRKNAIIFVHARTAARAEKVDRGLDVLWDSAVEDVLEEERARSMACEDIILAAITVVC